MTDECKHGSLRRSCEICERDEEIERFTAELKDLHSMDSHADLTIDRLHAELAEANKRIEELELEIRSILNDEVLLIPIAQIDMLWKRRSFYRVAALRAIDDCLDAINVGECEECGGSGVVREHERGYEDGVEDTCPTCHGHGWIITSVDVDKYGRIGTGEE